MQDWLRDILLVIVPSGLTGVLGWIGGRRRENAELESVRATTDTTQIDNHAKVVELYKKTLDDLEERNEKRYVEFIDSQTSKIDMLNEKIEFLKSSANEKSKLLQDEINLLRRQNSALRRENKELRARIKELEAK